MNEQGTRRPFFEERRHLRAVNAALLATLKASNRILGKLSWADPQLAPEAKAAWINACAAIKDAEKETRP